MSDTPLDITLSEPEAVTVTSEQLVPLIAKIEDVLEGEPSHLAFFALLAITIVSQYPGMTDDQIAQGIDRTARNIVQMAQEFEFENKLKARIDEKNAASLVSLN